MNDELNILVNQTSYPVKIIYKRIKNIYYRFKENTFYVTCPRGVLKSQIIRGLNKYGPSLIKRNEKNSILPYQNGYFYLFGNPLSAPSSGTISFQNGFVISYQSYEDLLDKLKPVLLDYVKQKTRYYEALMNVVPPYKVQVRKMSSRWGSNSKNTRTIHYALNLVHYSFPIIDSVIVHELCHDNMYNHSKAFYDKVYHYCPNYDRLHQCLRKRKYHD